jgi:hypothetical protein
MLVERNCREKLLRDWMKITKELYGDGEEGVPSRIKVRRIVCDLLSISLACGVPPFKC